MKQAFWVFYQAAKNCYYLMYSLEKLGRLRPNQAYSKANIQICYS